MNIYIILYYENLNYVLFDLDSFFIFLYKNGNNGKIEISNDKNGKFEIFIF